MRMVCLQIVDRDGTDRDGTDRIAIVWIERERQVLEQWTRGMRQLVVHNH
jgi:hypothetical protein